MPPTTVVGNLAPEADSRVPLRPFLKWAGGKRQLLAELRRCVPEGFRAYHEPFFGSGALFFDLVQRGQVTGKTACLVDNNADLMGCYTAIRDRVDEVIAWLQLLASAHRDNPMEAYYRVRDRLFNPARRLFFAPGGQPRHYGAELAAMFIYLNRTGFNGLFRLNQRGEFNVPMGRYLNPTICDERNLRNAAAALQPANVALRTGEFDSILEIAAESDFVYLDPPYAPVSTTANFTSYTSAGFSDDDQRRLQKAVVGLAARGCHVVLSNSTAPLITELYATHSAARKVGLRVHKVAAKRAINSDPSRRGKIAEYVITNVPRAPAA